MEKIAYSPSSLGEIIKSQRKARKLNQTQAGQLMQIEQTTVSGIEHGAPGTYIQTIFRMLAALELEMVIREKNTVQNIASTEW